jgi:uncharacterized membrane protein
MSNTPRTAPNPLAWFVLLMATAVGFVGAFWVLLGQRFSPENYDVRRMTPYKIEFLWFGGALVAVVCALTLSIRRRDLWRQRVCHALPVTAVSLLVLIKALLTIPIGMYDMLLFSVACGSTAWLWSHHRFPAAATAPTALRSVVWGVVVVLAAWQFAQQVRYLNNLVLGYADCGENARLMFNSVSNPRELFLRVNPDKPLFYDHINVGIIPFLPLWLVWPDLKLTILLEIVAVFGVTIPLYFAAKRVLRDEPSALLVVLAWLLYPSTSQFAYSASYGFRWGNMCLLLYFVALALWLHERRGWALVCAVWAMSIKEEAAIVIGMFGLYLAIFERRKAMGIALTAFAFGYFILTTSILVPLISGQRYEMTRFFFDLGHTKTEIFLSPLVKPRVFWGKLIEPGSLYFAAILLAPLLFLPLRRPAILFVGGLTFVFCCMNPILKNICFHYQAALLPVIFWAFLYAVQHKDTARQHNLLIATVVSSAAASLFLGALPWSKDTLAIREWPGRLELVNRVRNQIDPHASLFTTQRVGAHFVTQRYLYLDTPLPDQIDYALLDLRDSWRGSTGTVDWLERLRRIQREVESKPHLHLVAAADGLLLYSRYGTPLDPQKLVQRDDLPATAARPNSVPTGVVGLAGLTADTMPPEDGTKADRLRITAFFTIAARTNVDLAVKCIAQVGNDPVRTEEFSTDFQPLGQCVWPLERWEPNKYYAEVFILALPAGLAHEVTSYAFDSIPLAR